MTNAPKEAPFEAGIPATDPVEFNWFSQDGLLLSGRQWFPSEAVGSNNRLPVLCLPGLSRNTRDFNDIAAYLQKKNHHVVALDYRGRGKSEWDKDWRNYALPVEENDISLAIEKLGLDRFAVLGTSRGGLHALAMTIRFPANRMAAVILNDIGPHIEMKAIHRIAATLGRKMRNSSLQDVAKNLEHTIGHQFPSFGRKEWMKLASQLASDQDDAVVMDYDPALAHQFASLDDASPAPDLWPLYENLKDRPVLVVHGEHSDLLSRETCEKMLQVHPSASLKTVTGQGHAPVLWEPDTHDAIGKFLDRL